MWKGLKTLNNLIFQLKFKLWALWNWFNYCFSITSIKINRNQSIKTWKFKNKNHASAETIFNQWLLQLFSKISTINSTRSTFLKTMIQTLKRFPTLLVDQREGKLVLLEILIWWNLISLNALLKTTKSVQLTNTISYMIKSIKYSDYCYWLCLPI